MDEINNEDLNVIVEHAIDHVRRRYLAKLQEVERRNDLIVGELRRAHAEIEHLRKKKKVVARR